MDKNYYKILQIDKEASPEIIKKAYTTLAKKYHPDLQDDNQKREYEEKLKLINEAYEVLSNEKNRKQFDIMLEQELIENGRIANDLLNENISLKNELDYIKQNTASEMVQPSVNINAKNTVRYQQELQQAREKAYHDAYIQDLKNRGYKIKYKKTLKDYFKNFVALIITIFILFLLFQIPFVKNFFVRMYNENAVIRAFTNLFL